jgi:hypothetical protein
MNDQLWVEPVGEGDYRVFYSDITAAVIWLSADAE